MNSLKIVTIDLLHENSVDSKFTNDDELSTKWD